MPVKQDTIEVIVFIPGHRIKGTIYLHPGGRISDFLNVTAKAFIPVSDAQVFLKMGQN